VEDQVHAARNQCVGSSSTSGLCDQIPVTPLPIEKTEPLIGTGDTMMGTKERRFLPLTNPSLEDLVPSDHFYRFYRRDQSLTSA
jgi:hypothetical protein